MCMALSLASMASVRTWVQIYRDTGIDTQKSSQVSLWGLCWVCMLWQALWLYQPRDPEYGDSPSPQHI